MLCWNVYIGDFNKREIIKYNIFDNWSFYDACLKAKRKFKDDKEGFAKEVKSWLSYLFCAKCEWEIILDHWPNGEWSELRQKMTVQQMVDMVILMLYHIQLVEQMYQELLVLVMFQVQQLVIVGTYNLI